MLAGVGLQGCADMESLNLLAAIDGPYVGPAERAERERLAAERQALAAAAAEIATELPEPPATQAEPVIVARLAPTVPLETGVGPEFPAPELSATASPLPAAGTAALVGPVLSAEDRQQAALATQLPSAFDYETERAEPEIVRRPAPSQSYSQTALASPAQQTGPTAQEPAELTEAASAAGFSVVSALPTPDAPSPDLPTPNMAGSAYLEFYQFALARLDAAGSGGTRRSMLLLDPPSLDPELQTCRNQPPAVLIDLDPANGLLPLVSSNRASPELVSYLDQLRRRGVTIYWISGHEPGAASRIRGRLTQSALDPDGVDPLIVTRFAGESKQARRFALGETNCLLAILGDHRSDFDELYDFVLDPIMAGPLETHIGEGWFIAPPPLN